MLLFFVWSTIELQEFKGSWNANEFVLDDQFNLSEMKKKKTFSRFKSI